MKSNKKFKGLPRRLCAGMLALLMALTLVPMSSVTVYAATFSKTEMSNPTFYESGCLKSLDVTIQARGSYAKAYGKIGIHTGASQYTWSNRYISSSSCTEWPETISDPTLLGLSTSEFLWTDCEEHKVTVQFEDGKIPCNQEKTYVVHLWTRAQSYGIYTDATFDNLKTKADGKLSFGDKEIVINNETSSKTFSFQYAADCQRSPAYPKKGNSFKASGFKNPLYGNRISGSTMIGDWKLVSKGLYTGNSDDYVGNYGIDSVMSSASSAYGVDKTAIEVYELKDGDKHIAFGVLCGIFDGSALYIGDTWSGGGGYALSNKDLTTIGSISGTVTQDVTTGFEECKCTNVTKRDGQAATCTDDGWKDYYQCANSKCGKYYTSADKTTEIANLSTWKTGEGKLNKLGHVLGYTADGVTLTATCSRNTNHTATLTLTASSVTYSGDAVSASFGEGEEATWKATVGESSLPTIMYELKKSDNTYETATSTAPTNVGTYRASITVDGKTAIKEFTINKATISDSDVTLSQDSFVYSGEAKTPSVIVGKLVKDKDYQVTGNPSATNVGDYTVTITGIGNYSGTVDKVWHITKAAVTGISVENVNVTYDGTEKKITVVGALTGDEITYGSTKEDITSTNEITVKDATSTPVTVWYKVDRGSNYTPYIGSATITINKREIVIDWGTTSFVYNGSIQTPSATAGNVVDEDTCDIITTSSDRKDVGVGYTVTATELSNDNYCLPSVVTTTYEIKKKPVTLTAKAVKKHIGYSDPALEYEVKGLCEDDTLTGISLKRDTGEASGAYAIKATEEEGANPNYDVTFEDGTFTIEDHVAVIDAGVAATCTSQGMTDGSHCAICNTILVANGVSPALGHDWSGEWTIITPATATADGKQEKTCTRDGCGQKKIEVIPKLGVEEEKVFDNPNAGDLIKDAEVTAEAPIEEATLINTKKELVEASGIFTEEEKVAIVSGEDASVWIEIDEANRPEISAIDALNMNAVIEEIMGKNAAPTFFDASLFKQLGNGNKQEIHEPGVEIKVSLLLPNVLVNQNKKFERRYYIVRLHNGRVDKLDAVYDKVTGTLSFNSSLFSTYAIAYEDTEVVSTEVPSEKPVVKIDKTANTVKLDSKFKVTNTGKEVKIEWGKVADADGYIVYGAKCGEDFKVLKTIKSNKTLKTSLNKIGGVKYSAHTRYKFYVVAYKKVDGKNTVVGKTFQSHNAAYKDRYYTDAKSIKVGSSSVKLAVGETSQIKSTTVKVNKKLSIMNHTPEFRFASSNKKVATVDANGKITAKKAGTCTVYVYAVNGYAKAVKVTVK